MYPRHTITPTNRQEGKETIQIMIKMNRGDVPKATEEIETEEGTEETKGMQTTHRRLFSNAIKHNMNLLYCFSCGYDVDHDG